MTMTYLEGPSGARAAFDSFELATCGEYSDNHGRTFVEQLTGADVSDETEEAIGYMVSLYGHFPGGGVHSFADAQLGEDFDYAAATTYLRELAASLNPALGIEDYSFDPFSG